MPFDLQLPGAVEGGDAALGMDEPEFVGGAEVGDAPPVAVDAVGFRGLHRGVDGCVHGGVRGDVYGGSLRFVPYDRASPLSLLALLTLLTLFPDVRLG